MSPHLVLPKSWVLPEVDVVDLLSEDEVEDLEEDTSYE